MTTACHFFHIFVFWFLIDHEEALHTSFLEICSAETLIDAQNEENSHWFNSVVLNPRPTTRNIIKILLSVLQFILVFTLIKKCTKQIYAIVFLLSKIILFFIYYFQTWAVGESRDGRNTFCIFFRFSETICIRTLELKYNKATSVGYS